jgi:hypothetical protein
MLCRALHAYIDAFEIAFEAFTKAALKCAQDIHPRQERFIKNVCMFVSGAIKLGVFHLNISKR